MRRDISSGIAASGGTALSASRLNSHSGERAAVPDTVRKGQQRDTLENERDEIIEANERACALLGYSREELLKMKVSDLQAPEVRDEGEGLIPRELERHGGDTLE